MPQSDTDRIAERILRRERSRMLRAAEANVRRIDAAYAAAAERIKRELQGVTDRQQIETITRRALNESMGATLPAIEASVTAAVSTGATTIEAQRAAIFGATVAAADTDAAAIAFREAQAVLRGSTRVDGLTLSARLRRRHRAIAAEMADVTTRSIQAGESMTRTAERLLNVDDLSVDLPRYVRDLQDAARAASDFGDPAVFERAVSRWQGTVERLGSSADAAFSVRNATEQMIEDLRGAVKAARPEQTAAIVDRWALEKARHHARVIARSETVEAHRRAYVQSTRDREWVKGYRWSLGSRHPTADECMPAGTMIATDSGERPVETIKSGDMVLTHAGRYMPVVRTMRTEGLRELVRLRFQVGTSPARQAEMTPNHPVATERGWIPAGALNASDRVLCFPTLVGHQRLGDTACTCRRGSLRSSQPARPKTLFEGSRAAPPLLGLRMGNTACAPASIPKQYSGTGSDHSLSTRLSSSGLSRLLSCLKIACVSLVASSTRQSSAFLRSLGSALHGAPGRSISWSSSAFASPSAHFRRTAHTPIAQQRATAGSSSSRRTCGQSEPRFPFSCEPSRTVGTEPQSRRGGQGWHIDESSTLLVASCDPAAARTAKVGQALSIEGIASSAQPVHLVVGVNGQATTVYNLEVERDHSYVANGLIVHNCDALAGQDLYGLGPGGYPVDQLPPTPHPSDLCTQTAIIDRFHNRRELARRTGDEEPPREWESGRRETPEEWLRAQPESMRREILGPGRLRHFEEGTPGVLNRHGVPRPLWQIEGRERPARRSSPDRRRARPIVQRDREAGQVEPFPEI